MGDGRLGDGLHFDPPSLLFGFALGFAVSWVVNAVLSGSAGDGVLHPTPGTSNQVITNCAVSGPGCGMVPLVMIFLTVLAFVIAFGLALRALPH